ncbi:hypothetical protein ACH4ND_01430 [Streptomyces sp. NPDC017179]|uniref:hypothetical protein n=1 Tax=Streptomyces sp. NPDC017179 TaxID=3364979 RepID=UPI0037A0EDA7
MSDLEKAARDAVEAADNTRQIELIAAVLQAQQLLNTQPQQPACQHPHKEPANVGKWIGLGFAVCAGSIGLAVGFLAIAIAAPCATICVLILRSVWRDYLKHR